MRSLVVLLALAAPARAEMWASKLGDLLHTATRIEVIHVGTVKDTTISGNLVEAVRSPSHPGAVVQIDVAGLAQPVAGDDLLVVCDSFLCPRAAAIDEHGIFRLRVRERGDGAVVMPELVDRTSLAPLAAGHAAPALCFAGTIKLLDDPVVPPFTATLSATDGTGTGTIAGGRPVTVSVARPWNTEGIELRFGEVELQATAHLARGPGGCIVLPVTPTAPVTRTRASLTAALAGKSVTGRFATGAWTVPKGAPIAAGRHTIDLQLAERGDVVLLTDLMDAQIEHRVGKISRETHSLSLGFSASVTSFYPLLVLELPQQGEPLDNGAEVAALLAPRGVTAELFWETSDGSTVIRKPLGKIALGYVPEVRRR